METHDIGMEVAALKRGSRRRDVHQNKERGPRRMHLAEPIGAVWRNKDDEVFVLAGQLPPLIITGPPNARPDGNENETQEASDGDHVYQV